MPVPLLGGRMLAKSLIAGATASIGGLVYALENSASALAGGDCVHPQALPWSHSGSFSALDIASVRRGYEVYKQVCAACHSMKYVRYYHLDYPGHGIMTSEEVKAEAAAANIRDIDDVGQPTMRPGKYTDAFPDPYPNKKAAEAANGVAPPDLSLMALARHGNEDYIFSLLTGYFDPPAGLTVEDGKAYNAYFPGGIIGMPLQLFDEGIEYKDGTFASTSQQAKDVSTFLRWSADMIHDQRKQMALKILLFTPIIGFALFYWKKRIWAPLEVEKFWFRTIKGREPPRKKE